ncbi:MAG: hypothetical protein WCF67_22920 [Chitinophagaceae bacterium]
MKIAFRKMFAEGVVMPVLTYDDSVIDLAGWAKSTLGIMELEKLHELPDPVVFANYVERLCYRIDQLKATVEEIRGACNEIKQNVLEPVLGKISSFQFPPSIRCHLSGSRTASAFHTDGDPKYGLMPGTLNAWIPLTSVGGNNSIHIETRPGAGDYQAVSLNPGQLLVFDAYHLHHGSYTNNTPVSRVSIDIRFVPRDPAIAHKAGIYAR